MNRPVPDASAEDAPLQEFRGAHAGILEGVHGLRELPALAAAMERARGIATATLDLFDQVVLRHHAEEEQDLFDAVLRSCRDAAEREQVNDLVALLTAQHRQVEELWAKLRPVVSRVAAGKAPAEAMFGAEVDRLVGLYEQHARREEEEFLPLADRILRRNPNHMAALGVALHVRHTLPPRAYI